MTNLQSHTPGRWKFRSPLVPQWMAIGDGWLLGIIFRSPVYYHRPRLLASREEMSEFLHLWDE